MALAKNYDSLTQLSEAQSADGSVSAPNILQRFPKWALDITTYASFYCLLFTIIYSFYNFEFFTCVKNDTHIPTYPYVPGTYMRLLQQNSIKLNKNQYNTLKLIFVGDYFQPLHEAISCYYKQGYGTVVYIVPA